ncbi:hypothetical protein JTE90_019841 [Oedothorax gibbosus]|uniref:Uncharacterized protein n=1 Tax=Oedothorax gibbosus TaxID=931172 RepID=A0AAV6V5K8_9ARAC|nr:hypothetical protein JTE90_019841 [Oedothorax gibbosus]
MVMLLMDMNRFPGLVQYNGFGYRPKSPMRPPYIWRIFDGFCHEGERCHIRHVMTSLGNLASVVLASSIQKAPLIIKALSALQPEIRHFTFLKEKDCSTLAPNRIRLMFFFLSYLGKLF